MSSKAAKILESNSIFVDDEINTIGNGKLPSTCPNCNGLLDFGKINEDELICRNKCGWKIEDWHVEHQS